MTSRVANVSNDQISLEAKYVCRQMPQNKFISSLENVTSYARGGHCVAWERMDQALLDPV